MRAADPRVFLDPVAMLALLGAASLASGSPLPARSVAFEKRFEEATVAQKAAHTMSEKLKRNSPNLSGSAS